MMHYFALLLSTVIFPSMALAVFDIQVFGGSGVGKAAFQNVGEEAQNLEFQGNDMGVTLHLNPIETIPVSIGAGYLQEDPKVTGSASESYASLTGQQISLELMAWLPLNGYAVYGKIGEIVRGSYRAVKSTPAGDLPSGSPISEMSYEGKYAGIGAGAALTAGLGLFCELRAKFNGKLIESERSLLSEGGHGSRAKTVGTVSATSFFAGIEMGL
jgi:hypothetical protein